MKLSEYKLKNWNARSVTTTLFFKDIKIVLLDINKNIATFELLKNLLAIDSDNNILWIADVPDNEMYGYYLHIEIKNDLLIALMGSTLCTIDPDTGNLLKQQFVK